MAYPTVAIIMRTQDRPLTLDRALRSILGQRFQDWELIIVSDAGNLAVINRVLARYAEALDGRCRLLHREVSSGMEAASNFGVTHSRAHYVVLHDDDDSWHPDFLWATVGFPEGLRLALPWRDLRDRAGLRAHPPGFDRGAAPHLHAPSAPGADRRPRCAGATAFRPSPSSMTGRPGWPPAAIAKTSGPWATGISTSASPAASRSARSPTSWPIGITGPGPAAARGPMPIRPIATIWNA